MFGFLKKQEKTEGFLSAQENTVQENTVQAEKKEAKSEVKHKAKQEDRQEKRGLKWYAYLFSLIFVLAGLVLIIYVQIDLKFIWKLLACLFGAGAVISIASYCVRDVAEGYLRHELVMGLAALFAALMFLSKQEDLGTCFPILAGLILFVDGVVKLQHCIDMKRIDRKMKQVNEMWLVVMIFALICISLAFVVVYIRSADRTLFLLTGISLVVAGLSDVFVHIVFNRRIKVFTEGALPVDTALPLQTEAGHDMGRALMYETQVLPENEAPVVRSNDEVPAALTEDEAPASEPEAEAPAAQTEDENSDDAPVSEESAPGPEEASAGKKEKQSLKLPFWKASADDKETEDESDKKA